MYGRDTVLPHDLLLSVPSESEGDVAVPSRQSCAHGLLQRLEAASQRRMQATVQRQEDNLARANIGRKPIAFELGSKVWVTFPSGLKPLRKPGMSGKFSPRAYGPCEIVERIS